MLPTETPVININVSDDPNAPVVEISEASKMTTSEVTSTDPQDGPKIVIPHPIHSVDDIVTIYLDPITQKNPEGLVRLKTLLKKFPDRCQWLVEFLDEPGTTYFRVIYNPIHP